MAHPPTPGDMATHLDPESLGLQGLVEAACGDPVAADAALDAPERMEDP